MTERTWDQATHLLAVRLGSMSDILMATPALRALKAASPDRHLTLLTSPAGAEAAALVPEVDDVIVYDAPWVPGSAREGGRADREMIRSLWAGRFDAAVIFTSYTESPLPAALLCYLAEVPLRLAHCREAGRNLLSHVVPDPEPGRFIRHEVRRQLALAATIGCPAAGEHLSLSYSEEARQRVRALLRGLHLNLSCPWAVMHPGASAAARRYSPEHFAAVARALAVEYDWQLVFTGTAEDRGRVDAIRSQMGAPALSLAGRLSLEELAALIGEAPLLISNNTGPAHLAAAVGTPVVVLYALTAPQRAPWGVPSRVLFHDVPCRHCQQDVCPAGHGNCLALVPPERVVDAALELAGTEAVVPERRLQLAAL